MMQNRATQRRRGTTVDPKLSILDYFFERKDGPEGSTLLVPRTAFVTREELWWVLEWQQRRLPAHNRWYKKLWRWLRRSAFVTYDPFAMVRASPSFQAPAPEARRNGGKRFDADGNVVTDA